MNMNKKKFLPSQNLAEKQNHYGIRKLSIGAASVLLGSFFLLTSNDIVKADITDQTVLTNKNETTGSQSEDKTVESNDVVTEKPVTEPVSTTKAKTEVPVEPETSKENSTEATKDADSSAVTPNNEENANVESKINAVATSATEEKKPRVRVKRATSTPSENVAEVIDENAKSNEVTLTHSDNSSRVVSIITNTDKNDVITVEVPYIFTPTTDRSVDGKFSITSDTEKVDKPGFVTDKNFQNTTYTYKINQDGSLTFGLNLDPTVNDWSFLPEGTEFYVTVKKNGQEIQRLKYTIGAPAEFTKSEVVMDQNQTENLVPNEKYPVGIVLQNDGYSDGTQFSGTITLDVPDGFVIDLDSVGHALGLNKSKGAGDLERSFRTHFTASELFNVTQAGPGKQVIFEFHNVNKASLNDAQIGFFGYYEHALEAKDNNFKVTVKYHATDANNDRANGEDQIFTGEVKNINLAVSDQKNANIEVSYIVNPNKKDQVDEIFRDKVTENGTHDSDNPYLDYKNERVVQAYNNGNVAQTNVNLHLDIEPGTVLARLLDRYGNKSYGINLRTTSENHLSSIVVTLTGGRKINLGIPKVQAGQFETQVKVTQAEIDQGLAADGSNIKAIDIAYDNIVAGTKVMASFSNDAILDKNVDEKATYKLSVKSDQGSKTVAPLVLTVKDPANTSISFTGVVKDFENKSYQPTDNQPTDNKTGGNQANITYVLQNATSQISDPSSYLITVPKGFDISLDDLGAKQYIWQSGPSDLIKEGKVKITDLGKIGLNGEHLFRVDVSFTPSFGRPVYIGLVNPDRPLTITADKNELPSSYDYGLQEVRPGVYEGGLNGQELVYKLDDTNHHNKNAKEVSFADGSKYQVLSMIYGLDGQKTPKYFFTSASEFGKDNRIKGMDDNYQTDNENDPEYAKNNFDNHGISGNEGTLALVNVLTDRGTSDFSYNVINLPDVKLGDKITLQLTGKGTKKVNVSGQGNGQLLFSTKRFEVKENGEEKNYKDFVTADRITDWSQVKAVLLKSGQLKSYASEPYVSATAELGYKIVGMKDRLETAKVPIEEIFWGNHKTSTGTTSLNSYQTGHLNLFVQRYVDVTTKWVDDDNNKQPLRDGDGHEVYVKAFKAWDTYTTNGIAATYLPKHIIFKNVENPIGKTGAQDITITYHYQHEKAHKDGSKTITRTIHITYEDGTTEEVKQNVKYNYVDETDLYTNDTKPINITVDGSNIWQAYAPREAKAGYTIEITQDKQSINDIQEKSVAFEDSNVDVYVNYKADDQTLKIVYWDDTDNKQYGDITTLTGKTDQQTEFTANIPDNYVYVSSDLDGVSIPKDRYTYTFVPGDNHKITVHIKHDTYEKQEGSKIITRTINVITPDEQTTQEIQTAEFAITNKYDKVNNNPIATTYTPVKDVWAKYDVATIPGYTVNIEQTQPSEATLKEITEKKVASTDENVVINVTYVADKRVVTIIYQDKDDPEHPQIGETQTQDSKIGETITVVPTIPDVPNGYKYELVDKNTIQYQVTPDENTIIIYLKHKHDTVYEDKTVTRTINVYKPGNEKPETTVQEVVFTQTFDTDLVTGQKTVVGETVKSADNGSLEKPGWSAFIPDKIAGYTPDLEKVESQAVTSDMKDVDIDIHYNGDEQEVTINYYDSDDNDQLLKSEKENQKVYTGDTYTVKVGELAENYVLDADRPAPSEITIVPGENIVNIYLKHKHATADENKTITRTINVYKPGNTEPETTVQEVVFTQTIDKDLVTKKQTVVGETVKSADNGNLEKPGWTEFIPDKIIGYTPDIEKVKAQAVTSDMRDVEVNIHYIANEQHVTVRYVDDERNFEQVGEDQLLKGKTGSEITIKADQIPDNYEFVRFEKKDLENSRAKRSLTSDEEIPLYSYTFIPGEGHMVIIHLKHKHESISRKVTVTRTVRYVDEQGKELLEPKIQELVFTQTGNKDLVTGEIVWDNSYSNTQTFGEVISPEITGYEADRKVVEATDVTVDADNFTQGHDLQEIVTYTAKKPGQDQPNKPTTPNEDDSKVPGKNDHNKTPDHNSNETIVEKINQHDHSKGSVTSSTEEEKMRLSSLTHQADDKAKQQLPQTSQKKNTVSVLGLLLGLAGLTGLFFTKKKED